MCKHILIRNFNKDTDVETLGRFADMTADRDGYGAIIRTNQNELMTLKSLSLSAFYMRLGELIKNKNILDIVVHHRTSTNGQGIDYAHPFEFQGNYLTHNGVVSVPGTHQTKTTNDSEALLHHLIKSNYETETIQGYFSCFILNENTTSVIVDDKAPIFTDGRVFSSHDLGDSFEQLTLKRIIFDPQGNSQSFDIKVQTSTYGSDKAYLSLGKAWSATDNDILDDSSYTDFDDVPRPVGNTRYYFSQCDVFLRYVTPDDEYLIASEKSLKDRAKLIKSMARQWDIHLTAEDMMELMEYFKGTYYQLA